MSSGELGKVYADGELIVHEGEVGDCMYVIQEGQAEAFVGEGANEIRLNILDPGDFFGEIQPSCVDSCNPRARESVLSASSRSPLEFPARGFFRHVSRQRTKIAIATKIYPES